MTNPALVEWAYIELGGSSAQVSHRDCPKVHRFCGDSPERRLEVERSHLCGSIHTKWDETDTTSPGPALALLLHSLAADLRRYPTGVMGRTDVAAGIVELQEALASCARAGDIDNGAVAAGFDHPDFGYAMTMYWRRVRGLLVAGDPVMVMLAELLDGGGLPRSVGGLRAPISVVWPGFELCARHLFEAIDSGELVKVLDRSTLGRVNHDELPVTCLTCQVYTEPPLEPVGEMPELPVTAEVPAVLPDPPVVPVPAPPAAGPMPGDAPLHPVDDLLVSLPPRYGG